MSENRLVSRTLSMSLAFVLTLLATGAHAEQAPPTFFQLAFVNPLQIFHSERSVTGFRYSLIWGVNQNVTGFDLSTGWNKTEGSAVGYQLALMNEVGGDVIGLQTSLWGTVGGDFMGLQLNPLGAATDGHVHGAQWAPASGSAAGQVTGLQLSGFVNSVKKGVGLQLAGVFNVAGEITGAQISGLLNIADNAKGLQLGLLNFNKNGFLPFFPVFNFGF